MVPDMIVEKRVSLDIMSDFIIPQGRYFENFKLISLLEVFQEWWVKKGGTPGTLKVPDQRPGEHGPS